MSEKILRFTNELSKEQIFEEIQTYLQELGLNVASFDFSRPWGGYFVIDESQAEQFIKTFFPHLSLEDFKGFNKLSPKILLVAPHKRLSWQYHNRRSEIWKVIGGSAAVATSKTNDEQPARPVGPGTVLELEQGERHRLVGADEWGVIAEIWRHTDADNPSDEADIIRVQDDYGRES